MNSRNQSVVIKKAFSVDARFDLREGAGTDAVHNTTQYAFAVCKLTTDQDIHGEGLALTLGKGNELVCGAIEHLTKYIEGKEIEELMADFGQVFREMADAPCLRWLGPQKGVIHLALASVTNACFDLWAKSREVPLWKLLTDLSAEEIVNTLDLSYLEEVLTRSDALDILQFKKDQYDARTHILKTGYPGYDTSIGWFNYSDERVKDNIKKSMAQGFTSMKLKVGSADLERDIRRIYLVRETAGEDATIMLDANQRWSLPTAIEFSRKLKDIDPYWIEEPTHPDDISAHVSLAKKIKPIKLAMGEHVPNRVMFKNFLQSGCMHINQVDALRVGGISEFITISLLSKKFGVPVVPHVGDMGQIHQHLVLFNHLRMGHKPLFLEHIPHLKEYFKYPVKIEHGFYQVPQEPGIGADLKVYST
ncbi:MAG TPA: enolase C-terminal domain-like protein [Balneolaceae bacterium]|nr:enolase C-terminal domain-like protein [Balneolaceae bacterium]